MLPLLLAAPPAAYLLCYGGVRGPIDWIMHTRAHHGARDVARVALTFDDGPDPDKTPRLLDTLAELDVRATFFVCGERVAAHPELARRIVDEGHEIGNHTFHHPYLPVHRSRTIARELADTDREIIAATGESPRIARPPYGGRSPWNVRALRRADKRIVLWDVNSFDWRGGPPAEIAERVLERARAGSIVLFHDRMTNTPEALRTIVPALRARGLALVTATEALRRRA
jgi:peptidoglycan/xylan/chitin deacetylase (PgdA/CDA1 family)